MMNMLLFGQMLVIGIYGIVVDNVGIVVLMIFYMIILMVFGFGIWMVDFGVIDLSGVLMQWVVFGLIVGQYLVVLGVYMFVVVDVGKVMCILFCYIVSLIMVKKLNLMNLLMGQVLLFLIDLYMLF